MMCFQKLSLAGFATLSCQDRVCSGIHTLTPRREGSGASKKENVLWSHTVLGSNPNTTTYSCVIVEKLLDLCGLQCHHP